MEFQLGTIPCFLGRVTEGTLAWFAEAFGLSTVCIGGRFYRMLPASDDAPAVNHVAILRVDGMTCSACSSTVERTLAKTAGVSTASVSCVTNVAHVEFDPEITTVEKLVDSIEVVGFDASLVEVDTKQIKEVSRLQASTSVELKVEGMTCSACSGTVERHLKKLPGVDRVTVSLILNRAFVLCQADRISPQDLAEEVEAIGFDANIEDVSQAEARCGRANLHMKVTQLPTSPANCSIHEYCLKSRAIPGVITCQVGPDGQHLRLAYNPHVVGARQLQHGLQKALQDEAEVEFIRISAENEQLDGHISEMQSLRWDLVRAVPPATTVFLLTIGLPSVGCDQDHMGFLSQPLHHGVDFLAMLILCLATPVQFLIGRRFHAAAFKALKRRSPNMDVLVSVATNTAYFYSTGLIFYCLLSPETPGSHDMSAATGHFFTMGPVLIAVVLLGKFLEARAKLSAIKAMTDLPDSMPAVALLCSGDGERSVPIEMVELGDILRVFPGAKVPVDGTVISEATIHVDESLLTGESTAVPKKQGDIIMGGTTCVSGGCLMKVTKVGCDTALGQMCRLVQEAQASKAGVQRIADRVAHVFVPSVISLSVVTFLVWAFLVFTDAVRVPMGVHHAASGHVHHEPSGHVQDSLKLLFAMKFGMAVLMVACPCAMGLATPMAVMVATGVAAKRGCLVKSAAALESSSSLDAVVLDKTGTITEGAPRIQAAACNVKAIRDLLDRAQQNDWGNAMDNLHLPEGIAACSIGDVEQTVPRDVEACFWWLLGTLESSSDHPVAKCILGYVQQIRGLPPIAAPKNFEYFSGRGMKCVIEQLGGAVARVGNLSFYEEAVDADGRVENPEDALLMEWVAKAQRLGWTVVVLHVDSVLLGAVSLRDPVRKDAEWVVRYFKDTLGLEVWLCTGDNTTTAQSIAHEVGIEHVVAEALPLTKSESVQQLQASRRGRNGGEFKVCFVGDGINDAPALAQADVGIAIGVGAQIAIEAADVALVRSELSDCVTFLALSRATFRTVVLNFFWAFCFNVVTLPMAAGLLYPMVHIPPLIAGMGMATSSCLVVVSSLQLRSFKPPGQPKLKKGYNRLGGLGDVEDDFVLSRGRATTVELSAQVFGKEQAEP